MLETVVEVHDHFAKLGVAHAFGGALALAYYSDPRGTVDVDVNVFVAFTEAPDVVAGFSPAGFEPELSRAEWLAAAGVRLRREGDPIAIDLFFSLDEHYVEISRRVMNFPFGPTGRQLPFLSMEELAVFKLSFGRDKDWVDLRGLARAHPDLDLDYIERQLVGIRGPTMYPRIARLRAMSRDG